jgi:hypothetical protein
MFQNASNIVTVDGQEYTFEVTLFNSDFRVNIPYNKILELAIEETIYSTFPSARLIIDNGEDMIESFSEKGKNSAGYDVHRSYQFDCTGRDMILIKIVPVSKNPDEQEQIFPKNRFQLSYGFSVVNESVRHSSLNSGKVKVLTLMDMREFLLSENVSTWSTNNVLIEEVSSSANLSQKSNEDRKVKTGLAIKNFIKSALPESKFTTDWDNGKTKVFYSTPGTVDNMSVLIQLLDYHVSEKSGDNCLLRLERDGKLSLRAYETYFKGAINKQNKEANAPGAYIMDAFTLPYQSGIMKPTNPRSYEIDGDPPVERFEGSSYDISDVSYAPPTSRIGYELGAASWDDFEGLESYSFSNFSIPGNVSDITSLPVHNTNIQHKQFNVDNKDNHIDNIEKAFDKMYTQSFHGLDGKPKSIFPINAKKRNNTVVTNLYSTSNSKDYRLKLGRNTIFNKIVNYAPCLSFNTKGASQRICGRFISLFGAPAADTKFQDIIQGEWFVTHLVHTFKPGNYKNTITAVKFYSFK